jgi:hypothetical protein
MLRVGLSISLILSMVPGPWLCCCTAARLVSAAGLGRPSARPGAADPARQHDCCCCCHQTASPVRDKAVVPQRDGPAPARPTCPCRQRQFDLVSLPPAQGAAGRLPLLMHDTQGAPAAPAFSGCVSALSSYQEGREAERNLPFLTARDILRALHILRC